MTEPSCYDCKHSYPFGKLSQDKLQCRLYPPTVIEMHDAWFPLVRDYWYCGQHEPEPQEDKGLFDDPPEEDNRPCFGDGE